MPNRLLLTAILLVTLLGGKSQSPLPNKLFTKYQIIKQLSSTAFVFLKDGKAGIVDNSGKIICPATFVKIENINGTLITISNDTLLGVANINGKQVLPCNFEEVLIKDKNNFEVFRNGVSFIVDSQNHYIGPLLKKPQTPHYSKGLKFTPPKIVRVNENAPEQTQTPYVKSSNQQFFLLNKGDTTESQIDFIEKVTGNYGYVFTRYIYRKQGLYGLFDNNGNVLLQAVYQKIQFIGKEYFSVSKKDVYGVVDINGKEVLPLKIQGFDKFDEFGYSIVTDVTGNKGIVDLSYNLVFPFQKCNIYRLTDSSDNQNGLYKVQYPMAEIDRDIILDKFMKSIMPTGYFLTGDSKQNEYFVTNLRESGVVNSAGYFIFKCRYTQLSKTGIPANENKYYIAIQNGRFGVIDIHGNEILRPTYKYLSFLKDDLIKVSSEFKEGVIDLSGSIVLPIEYDKVSACVNITSTQEVKFKYIQVQKGGKYGLINEIGEVIVPLVYNYIDVAYRNGLCLAMLDKKIGYLDFKGKIAIPFDYDEGHPFTLESTTVKKQGRTFYIDTKGKEIKK